MDTLNRIEEKLASLRSAPELWDPLVINTHGFRTGPPVSEQWVQALASKYSVSLPQQYRMFLGKFGNTRVGPGNWFYLLEEALSVESGAPFPLEVPMLGACSPEHQALSKDEQWEDYGRLAKEWDKISLKAGVCTLSEYGCGIVAVLILNGPYCGRIWTYSGDAAYYGPFGGSEALHDETWSEEWIPTNEPKEYSFLDWYENWLDGEIRNRF